MCADPHAYRHRRCNKERDGGLTVTASLLTDLEELFDEHVVAAFVDGEDVGNLDVIEIPVILGSIQQVVDGEVVALYRHLFHESLHIVVGVLVPDGAVTAICHSGLARLLCHFEFGDALLVEEAQQVFVACLAGIDYSVVIVVGMVHVSAGFKLGENTFKGSHVLGFQVFGLGEDEVSILIVVESIVVESVLVEPVLSLQMGGAEICHERLAADERGIAVEV